MSLDDSHKNVNDVAYTIAKRARELANMKMDDLRLMLTSDAEGRVGSARAEFAGYDRGWLIEAILCEEFTEEIPWELEKE